MSYTWTQVANLLAQQPAGTRLRITKSWMEHPVDGGLRHGVGLPVGQVADYRLRLPDCRGLHVQDFGEHYEAHLDQTDPACDAMQHLAQDAPVACVVGAAVVGGLLGLLAGQSKEALLAGLAIGAGLGGVAAAAAHGGPAPTLAAVPPKLPPGRIR